MSNRPLPPDSKETPAAASTQARILAAAERALIAGGPGQLRVDRVAEQAGANKRMIYHYFGDRDGLVDAVLRLQHEYLRRAGPALSAGTHATLAAIMSAVELPYPAARKGSAMGSETALDGVIDPPTLQRAARILLPHLMQVQASSSSDHVTPSDWVSFCVEMVSLAFASSAPVAFPQPPGSLEFRQLSERLLTGRKPRYRLHSDSRQQSSS